MHGRSGIPEEITRLTADGLSNNQVESLNVQYQIYAQNEIIFLSCPVGGRNVLGYVGEKIKFLLEDGVLKQQLDMHGSDTGNTEEQFNSVSQVTYNVTRYDLPCLNSSCFSGTWRPSPVPEDRDEPKVKEKVHAEEDAGLQNNPGDWCQVPAPASDPPNLNATGAPCSCMSPSQLEYAMMMTKQIWNTCPDDERMDNEVCGVEEDYV